MFKILQKQSFFNYQTQALSKLIITRLPNQKLSFLISPTETVSEIFKKIKTSFKLSEETKIIPGAQFIVYPQSMEITEEVLKQTSSINHQSFLEILMGGNLFLYEKGVGDAPIFCYGVEMRQYSYINNRNVPENVAKNIAYLAQSSKKMSNIGDLLKKQEQHTKQQIKQWKQEKEILYQNVTRSIHLFEFLNKTIKQESVWGLNRSLISKIIGLMSANWVFLFALTYGKYGWDVGQPVSYITSLTVDLGAMTGIFDLEAKLQQNGQKELKNYLYTINGESNLKMAKWIADYNQRNVY